MYTHNVQYYETDKMGIVHHSNYIRWMEEARISYMGEWGYGYDRLESEGIMIPVVGVECKYKKTTLFPEKISIDAKITEFNGVKLRLSYLMKNEKDETVFEGESLHCFLNDRGRPVNIKKENKKLYDLWVKNGQIKGQEGKEQ